ncbi:MAG: FtsX-like permease family protein, partial [Candidatus Rokuibacteriota bacterium]
RRPWIDWIHTSRDQGAYIRSIIKWDDQPSSPQALVESMCRANIATRTAPTAPVYICLDAGFQEQRLEKEPEWPEISRFVPPEPSRPGKNGVEKAAALLRRAERPVIMFGRGSRGQELWQTRFGRLTSIRVSLRGDLGPFVAAVRARLDPEAAGFTLAAVRSEGLDRSRGAVDLGAYFVSFSFFLIVAALLLSASFFRLGVEQRAREIGTLRAVGFRAGTLRKMFAAEAAVLAGGGSLLGLAGGLAYAALLVLGLRTWWIGAVGTERLHLSASWVHLAAGAVTGIAVSIAAAVWTLRGLRRASPRALLSGTIDGTHGTGRRRYLPSVITAGASLAGAGSLLVASALELMPQAAAFFGGGALLLVASLAVTSLFLERARPRPIAGSGWPALVRLGVRSATHRPGRSLFSIGMVASAVFVIVSVEAFRKDPGEVHAGPHSGTGGYVLVARSALPIAHDLNSAAGREALNMSEEDAPELKGVRFAPFRVRPGDDASCLNLYRSQQPRVLGLPSALVSHDGFAWAQKPGDAANPWTLLNRESPGQAGKDV